MGTVLSMYFMAPFLMAASKPSTYVNYTLIIDPDATDRLQINLPADEFEENVSVRNDTRSPSVFVFQDDTIAPGANSDWHVHPGIVLITVADGSVEWYDAKCVRQIRKTGDFFAESDQLHFVRNTNSVPARLFITFIIAKGETYKIYRPSPPCAAALGLDKPRVPTLR
jgi:quercetin dioxygenase-like cupin family protein